MVRLFARDMHRLTTLTPVPRRARLSPEEEGNVDEVDWHEGVEEGEEIDIVSPPERESEKVEVLQQLVAAQLKAIEEKDDEIKELKEEKQKQKAEDAKKKKNDAQNSRRWEKRNSDTESGNQFDETLKEINQDLMKHSFGTINTAITTNADTMAKTMGPLAQGAARMCGFMPPPQQPPPPPQQNQHQQQQVFGQHQVVMQPPPPPPPQQQHQWEQRQHVMITPARKEVQESPNALQFGGERVAHDETV